MKFLIFVAAMTFLTHPAFSAEPSTFTTEQTRLLTEAEAQLAENPTDADVVIWKGQRLGYLGRYEEAIAVYEAGEQLQPKDARFACHAGH